MVFSAAMDFSGGVIVQLASDDRCTYEVVSIEEDGTAGFPVAISQLRRTSWLEAPKRDFARKLVQCAMSMGPGLTP